MKLYDNKGIMRIKLEVLYLEESVGSDDAEFEKSIFYFFEGHQVETEANVVSVILIDVMLYREVLQLVLQCSFNSQ